MKTKWMSLCIVLLLFAIILTSCKPSGKTEYKITVSGQLQESGVISYLGYEMNVYENQASNPCGDCPDQPVSIYANADASEIINAIAEVINRADDIWEVKTQSASELILVEKTAQTAGKIQPPSAPKGIAITGETL